MFYERKARRAVFVIAAIAGTEYWKKENTIGDRKREKIGEKDESVNY